MKSKLYNLPMLAILLLVFSSCEKIVDNVDLPDAKPKLVLFSYISPGVDTIFANLFLSRTIHDISSYYPPTIANAEVSISRTGGGSINLQFDPISERYYAVVNPSYFEPGQRYQIQARTPDGKKVGSFCEIPVQNTSLRVIRVDATPMEDKTRYRFRLEFDDIPGQPDYYRIIPKAIVRYEWDGIDQIYEQYSEIIYGEEFIAVKDRDGETFIIDVAYDAWSYFGGNETLLGLKVYLLATDEHYYHFHRSLQNYTPDNPFSEPTIVYTNVTDGLGVFAGFNPFLLEYTMGSQQ